MNQNWFNMNLIFLQKYKKMLNYKIFRANEEYDIQSEVHYEKKLHIMSLVKVDCPIN